MSRKRKSDEVEAPADDGKVECTVAGCGERVLMAQLRRHVTMKHTKYAEKIEAFVRREAVALNPKRARPNPLGEFVPVIELPNNDDAPVEMDHDSTETTGEPPASTSPRAPSPLNIWDDLGDADDSESENEGEGSEAGEVLDEWDQFLAEQEAAAEAEIEGGLTPEEDAYRRDWNLGSELNKDLMELFVSHRISKTSMTKIYRILRKHFPHLAQKDDPASLPRNIDEALETIIVKNEIRDRFRRVEIKLSEKYFGLDNEKKPLTMGFTFADPRVIIENRLRDARLMEGATWQPSELFGADGKRLYGDWHTADWAQEVASDLKEDERVCALGVFLDKAQVSDKGAVSKEPGSIQILNMSAANRKLDSSRDVLFYADQVLPPNKPDGVDMALLKDITTTLTIDVLLQRLEQINDEGGIPFVDGGKPVKLILKVAFIVTDMSENWRINMLEQVTSKHPCPVCPVHKDDLGAVTNPCKHMRDPPATYEEGEEACGEVNQRFKKSPLWKYAKSLGFKVILNTPAVERLHYLDVGLAKYVFSWTVNHILWGDAHSNDDRYMKKLRKFDSYFERLKACKALGIRKLSGSISERSKKCVDSRIFAIVARHLRFVLNDRTLIEDDARRIAAVNMAKAFERYYRLFMLDSFTDALIQQLTTALAKFHEAVDALNKTLPKAHRFNTKFPKYHIGSHAPFFIRYLGAPWVYEARHWEAFHKKGAKIPYRFTGGRGDVDGKMLEYAHTIAALDQMRYRALELEEKQQQFRERVERARMRRLNEANARNRGSRAHGKAAAADEDDADDVTRACGKGKAVPEDADHRELIVTYCREQGGDVDSIRRHDTISVRDADVQERVVASSRWHASRHVYSYSDPTHTAGKPRFDDVQVHPGEGATWYAEVQGFYTFAITQPGGARKVKSTAYVRWYETVKAKKTNIQLMKDTPLKLLDWWTFIELETISGLTHVAPDPCDDKRYYVMTWAELDD